MRKLSLLLALVAMGSIQACGDDDRDGGGGTDSGTSGEGGITVPDGGGTGTDTGVTPVTDSGVPGTDSGGSRPMGCDQMVPDIRTFAMQMPMAGILPRCSTDTGDCLAECATTHTTDAQMLNACLSMCADADMTPGLAIGQGQTLDCSLCLVNQFLYCTESMGCRNQLVDYQCCIAANCPQPSTACIQAMCATQAQAFFGCAVQMTPTCFNYTDESVTACAGEVTVMDGGMPADGGDTTDAGMMDDAGEEMDAGEPDAGT